MLPIVQLWSGREVRALREAKRMSIRAFAAHLGVSERMISKWEAGGEKLHPRPVNQAALDSSLGASGADVQARFATLLGGSDQTVDADPLVRREAPPMPSDHHHQVRHPIDGKLMAFIPEGVYLSGEDNQPVYVAAFYCDVFPTTNADYSRFTSATRHTVPVHWGRNTPPDDIFDHPVTYVTWHDAQAYAMWAAKPLPTANQWEKAARGLRGDIYPWGNQLTPAKCNVRESGLMRTTPVNRYHSGVSPYGIYDLCGNTWEWLGTQSAPGRYELKGSAFTSPFVRATPCAFNDASADMMDDDTGFRCITPAETMRSLLKMVS